MSINVTVSGNPISIRRGKMILSDLENIRKIDRDHRRRLRLEQVQEQSRALSKRLLERARGIRQEELDRLEKDGNTEMRRAHDKKVMEIHRRYQDIEDIGYAHENAARQPDIESIRQAEEEMNKAVARARGAEAAQRLQELNKVTSPKSKHQERLNEVRDIENERSRMVAQLTKKSSTGIDVLSETENVEVTSGTTPRRKLKHVISKKTPVKRSKHSKAHRAKTPSRVSVTINGEEMGSSSRKTSSVNKSKKSTSSKSSNVPKKVSDIIKEGNECVSDDNEPRKVVPATSSVANRLVRLSHTENYEINSCCNLSTTTISSSSSNDSSYYSDNISKNTAVRVTPKHHTSPVASKVNVYDHNTRQRNTYNMPSGLVERMNIQNEQSAEDLAKEIVELEKQKSAAQECQKKRARQRSQDAILREKIRKDYKDLLKKLEDLYKQDLKLQAKQVSCDTGQQVLAPSKKCKDNTERQKKMDRIFQTILRSSKDPSFSDRPNERPITITPRDYMHSKDTPVTTWKEPPYMEGQETDASSENDDEYECKRKIIDLLMKVEKSKRRLLQEYGDGLPDDVFNAVIRTFNQSATPANQEKPACHDSKPKTPEIQVINMSNCDGNNQASQKVTYKPKKPSSKTPARSLPKTSSKSTCDQQVQVELQEEKSKEKEEPKKHSIEPIIKIITPENVNSSSSLSSNSSVATDVVIDVGQTGVTVDSRSQENNIRIAKDSSADSAKDSCHRSTGCNTPVKISFEKKSGGKSLQVTGLVINADKQEIRLLTKSRKSPEPEPKESPIISGASNSLPESRKNSPAKKLSRSAPPTRHSSPKKSPSRSRGSSRRGEVAGYSEQRYRTQYTQVSIDSSTESSQLNSTSDTANGSRLYTRFQALAAKRVVTTSSSAPGRNQSQEASDASTVYESKPAAKAGSELEAMNRSTPVLELLASSSANEQIRRKARLVSPVSSPETPSPRTMNVPSNLPRYEQRASRSLKFSTRPAPSIVSRSLSKSTRTSYTVSTDRNSAAKTQTTPATTPRTSQVCSCRNPTCRLLHEQAEDTQSYALASCPEILKTYEDLQNVYTERIASLTDLIERVRNEQRGVELSVMVQESTKSTSRSDSNSQPSVSGNLMKNIDAIYTQLKRTLQESQKIDPGEGIEEAKPIARGKTSEKTPSPSIDWSKDTAASESVEEEAKDFPTPTTSKVPPKPRIVNDERVNVSLGRFQRAQKSRPSTAGASTDQRRTSTDQRRTSADQRRTSATAATSTATTEPDDATPDQMVEMLSREILEQSKSVNKPAPVDSLKDSDDSLLKQSQAAVKDSGDSSKNAVSTDEHNQSGNLDTSNSDFVPFLAGIPKISRSKNSSNGRGRPPVTLISGPYRPEIVSPAHELSTIVEFDTPDTANKSQVSTRSLSNKARKKLLPIGESAPSTSSSPSKKTDVNVTKGKPSLQVAPLPMHQSPLRSLNISSTSTARNTEQSPKKSLEKSPRKLLEKSPRKSIEKSPKKHVGKSDSLEKKRASKSEHGKSLSSDSMHTLPDLQVRDLQNEDNADGNYDFHVSQISELQSLPDENIDRMLVSEICEESKSKSASVTPEQKQAQQQQKQQEQVLEQNKGQLTLTSTASLSGVSGVSEISTTPSSDAQRFKCPSSSDDMELVLQKCGLGWAIPTIRKTREASALGSSSSSDVTPVNTVSSRLINSVKKQHQKSSPHELLAEISDVSSISIKYENKSTERSVLVKNRTSTPNRHLLSNIPNNSNLSNGSNRRVITNNSNNSNSDGTVSLSSFSSDLNIVVQNQSADISVPNISFSNKLN